MSEITLATSDPNLIVIKDRLIVSAKILTQHFLEDGYLLDPRGTSLSNYAKEPIVTRGLEAGSPKVARCDSITLSSDGTAIIAQIAFGGSELSLKAFDWYERGLLWSFAIKVEVQKHARWLKAIGIDRYAQID